MYSRIILGAFKLEATPFLGLNSYNDLVTGFVKDLSLKMRELRFWQHEIQSFYEDSVLNIVESPKDLVLVFRIGAPILKDKAKAYNHGKIYTENGETQPACLSLTESIERWVKQSTQHHKPLATLAHKSLRENVLIVEPFIAGCPDDLVLSLRLGKLADSLASSLVQYARGQNPSLAYYVHPVGARDYLFHPDS